GGSVTTNAGAGQGAEMKGACVVTPGEVLQILVGNRGSVPRAAGGGTFVVRSPYNAVANVLVVAGGGGGQGTTTGTKANSSGQPNGGNGGPGYSGTAAGGSGGSGGSCSSYGAGGGFPGD